MPGAHRELFGLSEDEVLTNLLGVNDNERIKSPEFLRALERAGVTTEEGEERDLITALANAGDRMRGRDDLWQYVQDRRENGYYKRLMQELLSMESQDVVEAKRRVIEEEVAEIDALLRTLEEHSAPTEERRDIIPCAEVAKMRLLRQKEQFIQMLSI